MVRVGIVGSGLMAGNRFRTFVDMDGAQAIGIYARSSEKAAAICEGKARVYESYEALLSECDAVVICLSNDQHVKFALDALSAGKHVLIEYPLCTDIGEARKLAESAEVAGRVLMVGNTIVHENSFAYLSANRDRFGAILSAGSRVAFYDEGMKGVWYTDRGRTGPIFPSIHYHHVEYFRGILGEVVSVAANEHRLPDPADPVHSKLVGGTVYMTHGSGATSCTQWYLSTVGQGTARAMWVNGERASVTIITHLSGKTVAVWDNDSQDEFIEDDWGVRGSCDDFLRAIGGQMDHRARLESDITTLKVALVAARAAESGQVERVDA